MNEKFWWYVARSSGMVAWMVLALAVVWGVLLSGRLVAMKGAPKWLTDVHRHFGALACGLVGLHIGALVADNYVHFGWAEVLVPFASSWKPLPVAWGVVGLYVLAAVEVTSLFQRRLSRRTWKRIHLASYGLFLVASIHGLTAGTDAQSAYFRVGMAAVVAATVFTLFTRLLARPPGSRPSRPSRPRPAPTGTTPAPGRSRDGVVRAS
jgi:hypothetical protein